ncbi:MAG: hypothetical protein JWR69_327, partial [Pedosphaera sp.]|nr:hypothetical protein [Pedosphaera sp.]
MANCRIEAAPSTAVYEMASNKLAFGSAAWFTHGRSLAWFGANTKLRMVMKILFRTFLGLSLVGAFWMSLQPATAAGTPGTVIGWGSDLYGRPQPPVLTNAVSISFYYHALALLSDGTVAAWGDNTAVPAGLSNVVAVAAGISHSLALLADGSVVQWGNQYMPPVPEWLNDAIAIGAGSSVSLAVRSNGTVVTWASGSNPVSYPPQTLTNAVGIAVGQDFAVAVTSDGRVVAWGVNDAGRTSVPSTATN